MNLGKIMFLLDRLGSYYAKLSLLGILIIQVRTYNVRSMWIGVMILAGLIMLWIDWKYILPEQLAISLTKNPEWQEKMGK